MSFKRFQNYKPCCLTPCILDDSCALCRWPLKQSEGHVDVVRHFIKCHIATNVIEVASQRLGLSKLFFVKTNRIDFSYKKVCNHPNYLEFEKDTALAFAKLVSQFGQTFVNSFQPISLE